MPEQRGFGNHGTESPGTCQAGRGDDHMNGKEDEVAHPGHGDNALQSRLNQANLAIRHTDRCLVSGRRLREEVVPCTAVTGASQCRMCRNP